MLCVSCLGDSRTLEGEGAELEEDEVAEHEELVRDAEDEEAKHEEPVDGAEVEREEAKQEELVDDAEVIGSTHEELGEGAKVDERLGGTAPAGHHLASQGCRTCWSRSGGGCAPAGHHRYDCIRMWGPQRNDWLNVPCKH